VPENDESGHATTHLDMNWRKVWLWSAVISAVLSVVIILGKLGYPGSAVYSLRQCMMFWASSTAMLTLIGVFTVLRLTLHPQEGFEKRRNRQIAELTSIRRARR